MHVYTNLSSLAFPIVQFIKEPKTEFPPGKFIEGFVTIVDTEKSRAEFSVKKQSQMGHQIVFSDLKEGDKVKGYVKKVAEKGLIISIKNSKLKGWCPISEV